MDKTSVIVVSSCVALLGLHWWYNNTPQEGTQPATPPTPALVQQAPAGTEAQQAPATQPAEASTAQSEVPAQPTEVPAAQPEAPAQPAEASTAQPEAPTVQPTEAPAAQPEAPATPVVQQPAATLHTLTSKDSAGNEVAAFSIQSIGGGVENVEMKGQAVDSKNTGLGNVRVNGLTPNGQHHYGIGTLMFNLSENNEPTFDNSVYHVVGTPTETSVTIAAENIHYNGCVFNVTKVFSMKPLNDGNETIEGNAYVLTVAIRIDNIGQAPLMLNNWGLFGGSICPVNNSESTSYTYYITLDEGDFDTDTTDERLYETDFDKLEWAGLMNQYYATIIQPNRNSGTALGNAIYVAPANFNLPNAKDSVGGMVMSFGLPAVNIAPKSSQSFAFDTFTGPKYNLMLADMTQQFRMIDDVMDYGWVYLISYPMNWMINTFSGWFGNWGVAIIIMTFVIRLLIWPLYRKSYMSMKRMSLLQPMMQEIKQRCGDDRQRASMEMMALYRKYNISPLGGCLPMLLQIPIFFAFFYVLQTAAELRGAEFIFWVTDLSQPDTVCHIFGLPLNILPFIMAASMVAMMKMSPSAGDPMQQKIMKWMPVLFFLFCYTYPSALALYWTTTNIISIIQTLIIRRLPQPTLEQAAADAAKGNKNKKEGFFARIQRMAEEQQKQLEAQKRGNMRNVTKKK